MAAIAKQKVIEDAARVVAAYGGAPRAHAQVAAVRWPTTGATKMVANHAIECTWGVSQRLLLTLRDGGMTYGFTIAVSAASDNGTITSADRIRYRHLRMLHDIGMVHCAAALSKRADLQMVLTGSWQPHLLYGGHIAVSSAIGQDTDIACPADFQKSILAAIRDLEKSATGVAILQDVQASGEHVTFVYEHEALYAHTDHATRVATVSVDPAKLGGSYYATLTAALALKEAQMPGWVAVGHELIHVINHKREYDAARARKLTAEGKGWDTQEEVVTITGYYEGLTAAVRPLSECALLNELNLPLRWGHCRLDAATAPSAADMPKYYGPNHAALRYAL